MQTAKEAKRVAISFRGLTIDGVSELLVNSISIHLSHLNYLLAEAKHGV